MKSQLQKENVTRKHWVDNAIAAECAKNQIRNVFVAHETVSCLDVVQNRLLKKGSAPLVKINLEKRNTA